MCDFFRKIFFAYLTCRLSKMMLIEQHFKKVIYSFSPSDEKASLQEQFFFIVIASSLISPLR